MNQTAATQVPTEEKETLVQKLRKNWDKMFGKEENVYFSVVKRFNGKRNVTHVYPKYYSKDIDIRKLDAFSEKMNNAGLNIVFPHHD